MKKISFAVLSVLFGSSLYGVDYSSMTYEQLEALKGTIPVEQREIFQEAMRNKKQNQNEVNKEYRDQQREMKLQDKEQFKEMKQHQKEQQKEIKQYQKEERKELHKDYKEQQKQMLQNNLNQNAPGQRKSMY